MGLLRAIPLWTYLLLAVVVGWGLTDHRLRSVRAELAQANARVAGNAIVLEAQKQTAAALLATETTRVATLQAQLQQTVANQEAKDATNQITVDNLGRKLATASRLRDPNAKTAQCGGGSAGTAGTAGSAAPAGAANTTQADGVLSVELTNLLRRLTREADEVNNAYASCRATLIGTP